MDVMGNTVGRSVLREGVPVTDLAWSCERFNMEEGPPEEEQERQQEHGGGILGSSAASPPPPSSSSPEGYYFFHGGRPFVLAAALKSGEVLMLRSYEDVIPQVSTRGGGES